MILLATSWFLTDASARAEESFSVYCTSNQDGTGRCVKESSNEKLSCIMIPGQVIACKDAKKINYECVQYGAVVAMQTQFVCSPDADKSLPITPPDLPTDTTPPAIPSPTFDSNGF